MLFCVLLRQYPNLGPIAHNLHYYDFDGAICKPLTLGVFFVLFDCFFLFRGFSYSCNLSGCSENFSFDLCVFVTSDKQKAGTQLDRTTSTIYPV